MGFECVGRYRNFVNDQEGRLHDLVVLLYPMAVSEEEMYY
jgi:hypothetical protein